MSGLDDATVEAIADAIRGYDPEIESSIHLARAIVAALPDPRPTKREVLNRVALHNDALLWLNSLGCFRPEEDTRG